MAIERIKLTPDDRQKLEDLGPDIEALEAEINRAERAGIDVTQLKDDLAKAKTLREGVLREYSA